MRILTVVLFPACSIVGPRYQTLHVVSNPGGAEVAINGEVVGTTPLDYEARRNRKIQIRVSKEGYHPQYRSPDHRVLSTLGGLDSLGGCFVLLPFFGLLSDGAWAYAEDDFQIRLQATNSEVAP